MHRLLIMLTLSGSVAACGDDPPPQASRRRAAAKPAAAAATTEAVNSAALPKKLQNLKAEDWAPVLDLVRRLRDVRDPFKPFIDDLVVPDVPPAPLPDEKRLETKVPEPPGTLTLIGIITGKAVHEAMVVDSNGLGHTIRQGDMVGNDVPYRVVRITRNEVLFQPIQPPTAENKLEEVRKFLLTQDELEEQLP